MLITPGVGDSCKSSRGFRGCFHDSSGSLRVSCKSYCGFRSFLHGSSGSLEVFVKVIGVFEGVLMFPVVV